MTLRRSEAATPTGWPSTSIRWKIRTATPKAHGGRKPARGRPRDAAIGKITTSSSAFAIFTRHGWYWGGFYVGERDYMHFNVYTIGGKDNPLERPYVVNWLQYVPGGAYEASGQKTNTIGSNAASGTRNELT